VTDNKADNKNEKPEEKIPPRKKIEKPLNPLANKPGQNYGTTKFDK
jgi:hypothetical protein